MSYFDKLSKATTFSTKSLVSEPGGTKTNPIVVDEEPSTEPEPGSTKTNPIMIDVDTSPAIKFSELLEKLTYETEWPASSGQEAEIPKALALSLDECYSQEAERSFHEDTGANECSSLPDLASNPIMIQIDKDLGMDQSASEAGTKNAPGYLGAPSWEINSPPVTFGSRACELVLCDVRSSEWDTDSSNPKKVENDSSPSGSTPNPIVTDECDSNADTEIMTTPQFWEIIQGSPFTARAATSQSAIVGSPECGELQKSDTQLNDEMAKVSSNISQFYSGCDTMKDTDREAGSKLKILHSEAPATREIIGQGKGMPRSSRPPKRTSCVPSELRRSKRLRSMA